VVGEDTGRVTDGGGNLVILHLPPKRSFLVAAEFMEPV
jgi:hypothetical protein